MNTEDTLKARSSNQCELCTHPLALHIYPVSPSNNSAEQSILLCDTCFEQINDPNNRDVNHWHCLSDSMWNPVPAVQVVAYRMLKQLSAEGWAQDLLDTLYLDPELQIWADAGLNDVSDNTVAAKDSNGTMLNTGDSVTLIKDLEVKGAGFTAKRGTLVKNIVLTNNPEAIEGRINGVKIVLKTCFMKKA